MTTQLHTIDIAILAAYLLGAVAFGLWMGRGTATLSDYLLGGRDLPWWALLGSIVATETSTATFLSVPGIAFAAGGDLRFLQLTWGFILGRWIVVLVLLPGYFRGELYTAYDVLNRRFGGSTRTSASVMFLVARNLGDGLRLFLTAIVLEQAVGWSLPASIAVIGAVTIGYTLFGGMKSVVWNDCVQLVVYVVGGFIALAVIISDLPGGWSQVQAFGVEHDKWRVLDLSFDLRLPYTLWAGVVGGMFLSLGTHGADQMMVQRCLAARSQREAGRAVVLSGFVVAAQFALFLVVGVALAAFYAEFPPAEAFNRGDSVFAAFIVNHLPTGLVGLVLAAVFAAAMSTLSSSLNASASSMVNDLYLPLLNDKPSAAHQVAVSRALTVAFGLLQIGIAIAARTMSESVVQDALAIAGFVGGVLLGVFFLGICTNRVGQTAALCGMCAGLAAVSAVKFATPAAWPWYAVVGAAATFSVGLITSWVVPAIPERAQTDSI